MTLRNSEGVREVPLSAAHDQLRHGHSMTARRRSVLLVGPRPLFLDAAASVLSRRDFVIAGKEASARGALRRLAEHAADVVLVDAQLAEEELVTLLRRVRGEPKGPTAVVLGDSADDRKMRFALEEGAAAAVLASAHPEDLAMAIRQVLHRSVFLQGDLAERPGASGGADKLTEREVEVLQLVADGLSNAAIARRLWVTEQTVKFHLSNVYRKLGVANRTEAARWAHVHGLMQKGDSASTERKE
jgi:DNA-binding NarL/FixJ family response regulator